MADDIQTLGSYEIFPFLPDYQMGIEKAVIPAFNIVEYIGTISDITSHTDRRPITFTNRIQLHSMQDLDTLLQFIDDHKGRLKKFWYFMRTTDFTLQTDFSTGATDIDLDVNGYEDIFVDTDRIYFLLTNGDILTRRVTNVVYDSTNNKNVVSITPSLDRDLNVADINYFGRVLMVRFDLDKFSMKHEANSVAITNLRFIELPTEYPAT